MFRLLTLLLLFGIAEGSRWEGEKGAQAECRGGSIPSCVSACPAGAAFLDCQGGCAAHCAKPTNVLFIGNSLTFWNGGTETHVRGLAESAGYTLGVNERTVGGATLGSLYRNSGNNNPRSLIASGDYDVVILQEDMPELQPRTIPAGIQPFYEYSRLFDEDIRAVGSTPLFYMAWAFQRLNW